VVGELLGDLVDRGLDFTEPRLYILDGGKALTAAVKKHDRRTRTDTRRDCAMKAGRKDIR
jgi:hypothetical protein